ncbi:DnaJ (Hsp40), sub C, member 17 [Gryganskiella cystojenkinii]|nr:DnaJ (Hsp40), sub C, member 17 [Gryganskiella cystojenkinii]
MAEEQQDWYAVLGVARTATTKEITKAYRKKALKVHPDKNPSPDAAKVFHELSQAYDLLLDPAARAAFDNLLNVKVQAKERTDRYDSTRKKMKEDLEMRENASKKQQQDEKTAAMRMQYEMDRLKKENIRLREEREAELLREADVLSEAMEASRRAAVDQEVQSLDCTLTVTWSKKKHTYETEELKSIFEKFGSVDSCLSRKQGKAVVAFSELTGAYSVMRAQEQGQEDLAQFTIGWAGKEEPAAVTYLRAKSTSRSTTPTSPSPSMSDSGSSRSVKSAFNTSGFKPAFSTPAFGSGRSFGPPATSIPSFGAIPSFNMSRELPPVDDYEAATLARMRSKDNERKRLAEEMLRMDREEDERLQAQQAKDKALMTMDLLNIRSLYHEGARQAAGSFMSPLTNAILEQRRLVDGLSVVSKVRVEECKHMMIWGKSQTEDLEDVLLKLNLLIRKISDYELCFGNQYEQFRERIKYLRTKDDTLCEMGRRQNDLQAKIVEASKSRLRSAKAILMQKELEKIQKEDEPAETELQQMKRHLIKDAYTGQLNALIELGKKMQIIGEHGKQLLEHIHVNGGGDSPDDGEATEEILMEARIALENWSQHVNLNPQTIVVHPPSPSVVSVADNDTESLRTIVSSTPTHLAKDLPDAPPLPPRTASYSSTRSGHSDDGSAGEHISKEESLRRQEELELKKAMELSLESSTPTPTPTSTQTTKPASENFTDLSDLNLTEEELRFVMSGDVVPQQLLTKKLTVKIPLTASSSTKKASPVPAVPKVPRGPQMIVPEPQDESKANDEELGKRDKEDSTSVIESMGDIPKKSAPLRASTTSRTKTLPLESMGADPERPLESMGGGPDAEVPLESMGAEARGHLGQDDYSVAFVPMPEVPSMEGVRQQKIVTNLKKKQQEQLMQLLQLNPNSPFPNSPELQFLQVASTPYPTSPELQFLQVASPQVPVPASGFSPSTLSAAPTPMRTAGSVAATGTYQAYKPSTTYVPQAAKQKNRQSQTPPPRDGQQQQQLLSQSSTSSNRSLLQQQRLKFLQEQKQQQKMFQDFYYTPYEQESSSSDLTDAADYRGHAHSKSEHTDPRDREVRRYSMPPSDNHAYKVEF